ncbi:hypothetical protein, partial [Tannerella forsythia]|uniref:hypothetical protein n=1 Tax=Tannerella forsythia TaxID=28112 RepID=UPI0039908981
QYYFVESQNIKQILRSDYEIYESLKRKPTRAILTGIGIAWGIFILILLNEYPCLCLKTPLNYLITIIWIHGLE